MMKKIKNLQDIDVTKLSDIRQVADPEPEPPCEFEDTIPNGTCDKLLEKIISETNKE